MSDNLEKRVLSTGVQENIGNSPKGEVKVDYSDEIKLFKKKRKEITKDKLPFVNQDKSFEQIARVFSTQYHYAVLIGKPGIGKSMMLEYVSDIITNKVSLEEIAKKAPKTLHLFEKIKAKANEFEKLSYLLLPNMADPLNVNFIPYSDENRLYEDESICDSFSSSVATYINEFIHEFESEVKFVFSEKDLRTYLQNEIHELYLKINKVAGQAILDNCRDYKNSLVTLVDLKLNKDDKANYDIRAEWNVDIEKSCEKVVIERLKEYAGFKKERTNISKEEFEKGLTNTVSQTYFTSRISNMISDLSTIILEGSDEKRTKEIFEEEFEKYNDSIGEIMEKYEKGEIKTQTELLNAIRDKEFSHTSYINLSDYTLDYLLKEIKTIVVEYEEHTKDSGQEVKDWIHSVYDFFSNNRRMLKNSLEEVYFHVKEFRLQMIEKGEKDKMDPDKKVKGNDTDTKKKTEEKKKRTKNDSEDFV
ncbi:hypothetical protein KY321_05595, partial [Candidatus Woesearchaeota archaeon]|nr:hypothetical protein [Candidatus Woesearchaeota archaeon]